MQSTSVLNHSAIAAACMLALSCTSSERQKKQSSQPNIVLFYTDDNAFWYWGFGGGPKLSPTIDQIATDGVQCTQFYATASVSTPSRYSLHTGKYAGRCQSLSFLTENPEDAPYNITWNTPLHDSKETTMGQVFQQGGYRTGFVGKWHLGGYDLEKYNFKADDDPANPEVDRKLKAYQQDMIALIKSKGYNFAASITPSNNDTHPIEKLQHHNLEWYAKGAIDFIRERKNDRKPFFLIINITTHHGPCHDESLMQDLNVTQAGYVDGLEGIMPSRASVFDRIKESGYPVDFKTTGSLWTDDLVKAVMDEISNVGIEKNTAVVFTTDHNRFDGKSTCYQGGVHIPFIMKYPGRIQAGSICEERMLKTDLFPTFMAMCNIEMPNIAIDGKNKWAAISGQKISEQQDTLFFEFGYTRAVLLGDYKYIAFRLPQDKIEDMRTGKVKYAYSNAARTSSYLNSARYPSYFEPDQLFNVKEDYEEQINLATRPEYAEKLAEMKSALRQKLAGFKHPFPLDELDPFYFSDAYKKLCDNERAENSVGEFYWYQRECY